MVQLNVARSSQIKKRFYNIDACTANSSTIATMDLYVCHCFTLKMEE